MSTSRPSPFRSMAPWRAALMAAAVVAAAASLTLSRAAAAPGPETLNPQAMRITDEAIAADLAVFAAWQERLDALADAAAPPCSLYHRVKAQAWLRFAREEYGKNDRTGAVDGAFNEATNLIARLETGECGVGWETPLVAGAHRMGPELWTFAETIRSDPGFHCAQAEVARLEIELVVAGHEQQQGNACYAEPHLTEAQRLAESARAKAEACRPQPKPAPPPPPPRPTAVEIKRQIELLPKFVHFALDKSNIGPVTAEVLDKMSAVLRAYPQVRVQLEGHADKRATADYNLALSRRRAEAVRDYLVQAGVSFDRLDVYWYGKSRPRVAGESIEDFARNRCVIFRYIPPKDVEIQEVLEEQDLQPESGSR